MAPGSAQRAYTLTFVLFTITTSFLLAAGFDLSRSDNDDTFDVIPLAFLYVFFSKGGLPEIDLADTCSSHSGNVFPDTNLAMCPQLANDIKGCQKRGKIVTISLGGATGSTDFSSDEQARTFAETVWNLFLGGSSNTRPFGDAVLDGVDLDIESESGTGMAAFVTRLRELSKGASKRDHWAKNTSPNKNVKIYIGAPAAESAANTGYVSATTLGKIAQETRSKYSSFGGIMLWDVSQAYGNPGNDRYDIAIKNDLAGDGEHPIETTPTTIEISTTKTTTTASPTSPTYTMTSMTALDTFATTSTSHTTLTTTTSTTTSTTAPTLAPESCEGIAKWALLGLYFGDDVVTYNGHKWTARWWSLGDTPGGVVGVWKDSGYFIGGKEDILTEDAEANSLLKQTLHGKF
ncbi:hypothetical protein C0995_001246 [Termitomyces sp. Mi166|nr:hypothetical protein C0995_001246 [Termitomyces sp. Mi166\